MAGSRIKGITVEIGGDTTKLQTVLKGVNTEIRNTQSQLRDVEKLLKLDPGNTELLAQKHRLLGDAVKETKEKLETLKLAAEQANTALANGEISQEQYDALQREIIETENALKNLEQQAGRSAVAVQKIAATGEKLKTVGDNISSVGQKFLPVTGAVGALGAAAVKTAADFDSAMSQVAAVSGATGDDLDRLREKAREMGAKTKFSASEAAEAMNYMAMAGWKTEDMLSGIEGIMNLAAASGEDLATTSDIVTDALTAFGLSAKDSGHFADILADCRAAFSGLSESEKAAAAETLVGKNAMSGFLALMNAAPADIEKLSGAIAGCGGTAEKMAETMQGAGHPGDVRLAPTEAERRNLAGQLTILKSQLEELAISFGELLMPAIRMIVGWIQTFVDWLNGMGEGTKKVIVTIALLAAAIGPVLIVIGKVVSAVGSIMAFVPKLVSGIQMVKTAFSALGAVMAANPLVLIVAAVAAAVAALVLLYQKCEWFRDAVNGVWAAVQEFFVSAWTVICSFFTDKIPDAWNSLAGFFGQVPAWWSGLWNSVSDFFGNIWTGMMNNPVLSGIVTLIRSLWENLVVTLQGIWTGLQNIAAGAWELIKNVILAPVLLLIDLLTGNFTQLREDVVHIFTNIQSAASMIWSGIRQVVSTLAQGLVNHVVLLLSGLRSTAANIWAAIKNTASSAWNVLKNTVVSIAGNLKNAAVLAFQNMVSGIRSALSSLGGVVQQGFQSAISFITSLPGRALGWGRDFVNGIANGIRGAVGNVVSAVSDVANAIRSVLHFSVPDEGPLTDYESWMPDFMGGLARGIEKSRGMVQKAMDGVAADMVLSPKAGMMDYDTYGGGFRRGDGGRYEAAGRGTAWRSEHFRVLFRIRPVACVAYGL